MSEGSDDESTIRPSLQKSAGGATQRLPSTQADTAAQALPPGTRVAEFEVRGVIGEGGFSIVYQAWDESLHRLVALKEYIPYGLAIRDPSRGVTVRSAKQRDTFNAGLASFINEARLLASFDHPALVKVHRFWQAAGTAYMVMPWYQGPTLKKARLDSRISLDEAWLRRLLDPLTDALGLLHQQDCFHRDIAPDNILLLGAKQLPLLLDFGAARRVIGTMTQDLTAILKQGYAPIEQYGEIPGMRQGPWTDVYALAAVVYFAIRGHKPPAAVARIVNDTYLPLSTCELVGFDQRFLAAIDAALVVRPEQRTASISEFRQAIGLEGAPLGAARSSPVFGRPSPAPTYVVDSRESAPPAQSLIAPSPPAIARSQAPAAPSLQESDAMRPPTANQKHRTVAPNSSDRPAHERRRRWITAAAVLVAGILVYATRELMSIKPKAGETIEALPADSRSGDRREAASPSGVTRPQPGNSARGVAEPLSKRNDGDGHPSIYSPAAAPAVVPSTRVPSDDPGEAVSASHDLPVAGVSPAASVGTNAAHIGEQDITAERTARRGAEIAVASLQRLANEEQRDVAPAIRTIRDRLNRAQVELQSGRADKAAMLAREGQALAVRTLNGLIDDLIRDYGQLAQRARAEGETDIAQQALERSGKVAALRR